MLATAFACRYSLFNVHCCVCVRNLTIFWYIGHSSFFEFRNCLFIFWNKQKMTDPQKLLQAKTLSQVYGRVVSYFGFIPGSSVPIMEIVKGGDDHFPAMALPLLFA